MRMFRLQPFSMVCCAYQMRSAKFFSLSKIVQLWNHGNCAATCCTKSSSGQAAAKALLYLRFRGEKPLPAPLVCVSVWFSAGAANFEGGCHSKEATQPAHHPHSVPLLHVFGV